MRFNVEFEKIKEAVNIVFLNDDAQEISITAFKEDLKTGYRAGMVLVPVSNAVQIQVAMMTPYHKDHYEIDPGFLVEKFQEFCQQTERQMWIPEDDSLYMLGEVTYE